MSSFDFRTHTFGYCEKNLQSTGQNIKIKNKLENKKYNGTNGNVQKVLEEMFESVECSIVEYPGEITLSDNGFSTDGLTVKTRVMSKLKCHHDGSPIYRDSSFCLEHKITEGVGTNVSVGLDYDVCYSSKEWKSIFKDEDDYLKYSGCLGVLPENNENLDSEIKKAFDNVFIPILDKQNNVNGGSGIQPNFLINDVPVASTYGIESSPEAKGVGYHKGTRVTSFDNDDFYPANQAEGGAFQELGGQCLFSNFAVTNYGPQDQETIITSGSSEQVYYADLNYWEGHNEIKAVSDLRSSSPSNYESGPLIRKTHKVYDNQKRQLIKPTTKEGETYILLEWDTQSNTITIKSKLNHDYMSTNQWSEYHTETYKLTDKQDIILCMRPLATFNTPLSGKRFIGVIKSPYYYDDSAFTREHYKYLPNFIIHSFRANASNEPLISSQTINYSDGSSIELSALAYSSVHGEGRNGNPTTYLEGLPLDTIYGLADINEPVNGQTLRTGAGTCHASSAYNHVSVELELNDIYYFDVLEFFKNKQTYSDTYMALDIHTDNSLHFYEKNANDNIHEQLKGDDLKAYQFTMKQEVENAIFFKQELKKQFVFDPYWLENRLPYQKGGKAIGYEDGAIMSGFNRVSYTVTIKNVRNLTNGTTSDYDQSDLYVNDLIENTEARISNFTDAPNSMIRQHYFHGHIPYHWFSTDGLDFTHDIDHGLVLDSDPYAGATIIRLDANASHAIQVGYLKQGAFDPNTNYWTTHTQGIGEHSVDYMKATSGVIQGFKDGYSNYLPHSKSLQNIKNRMISYSKIGEIPVGLSTEQNTNKSLFAAKRGFTGTVAITSSFPASSFGLTMGISLGKKDPSGAYSKKLPSIAILLTSHNSNIDQVKELS